METGKNTNASKAIVNEGILNNDLTPAGLLDCFFVTVSGRLLECNLLLFSVVTSKWDKTCFFPIFFGIIFYIPCNLRKNLFEMFLISYVIGNS